MWPVRTSSTGKYAFFCGCGCVDAIVVLGVLKWLVWFVGEMFVGKEPFVKINIYIYIF